MTDEMMNFRALVEKAASCVAMIIAVGVNADGRREVLGMDIGPSEAGTFWTEFLRKLRRRGLRGVKLVISDAHEGIKAAVAKLMNATWQRCQVHTMRKAIAHAGKSSPCRLRLHRHRLRRTAPPPCSDARADQLGPKLRKLAGFMDEAENEMLAYMSFPAEHWSKIHSTDEIDKRFLCRPAISRVREKPCGEARRVGCKRRLAFYPFLAGLSRSPASPFDGRVLQRSTKRAKLRSACWASCNS
jgi:putative transposase